VSWLYKEEFVEVVKKFEKAEGVDGYEMNLSCPNVAYGAESATRASADAHQNRVRMFAHDATMIEEVVSAVRSVTDKTLIANWGRMCRILRSWRMRQSARCGCGVVD